jgi:PAS domain S-box-containing protein
MSSPPDPTGADPLAGAFELVGEPTLGVGHDDIIRWANDAARSLFGFEPGTRWTDRLIADHPAAGRAQDPDRATVVVMRDATGQARPVRVRRARTGDHDVVVADPLDRAAPVDRFASLTRDLLTGFVATGPADLDAAVGTALARVAVALGASSVEAVHGRGPARRRWTWTGTGSGGELTASTARSALRAAVDEVTAGAPDPDGVTVLGSLAAFGAPRVGLMVAPLVVSHRVDGHVAVAGPSGGWNTAEVEVVRTLTGALGALVGRCDAPPVADADRHRLSTLVRDVSDAVVVVAGDGTLRWATPALARMVGGGPAPYSIWELAHPGDHGAVRDMLAPTSPAAGPGAATTVRLRRGDGSWVSAAVSVFDGRQDPTIGGVVFTARDVSDVERFTAQLRRVADLETVLQRVTRRLIDVDPDDFDTVVEAAVGDVGRELGADRGYVNVLGDDQWITNTHEWTAPGVPSVAAMLAGVDASKLRGWDRAARDAGAIVVADTETSDTLDDQERAMLRMLGSRSVLDVWFRWQGRVTGSLGFVTVGRPKVWDDVDEAVVRRLADAVAAAGHRCRLEVARRRSAALDEAVQQAAQRLVDADVDGFDAAVVAALGVLGDALGADRGYVVIPTGPGTVTCTHEWTGAGVPSVAAEIVDFDLSGFQAWTDWARVGGVLAVDDTASLDADDPARALFARFGCKSVLDVAFNTDTTSGDGALSGFVGFVRVDRPAPWGEEAEGALRRFGSVFTAVQSRQRAGQWWRALVERSSDMVAVLDGDGRFRYVSPNLSAWAGRAPGDLVGERAAVFVPAARRDDFEALLGRVLGTTGPVTATIAVLARDGSTREVECVAVNRCDDPVVGGVVFNARDVTDRVAVEKALDRSERWHRSVLAHTNDTITVRDAAGNMTWASPSVSERFGADALLGRRWRHIVHPVDLVHVDAVLAEVVAAGPGASRTATYRARTVDGWTIWEVRFTNLLDDPDVAGVVGNGRDVTVERAGLWRLEESERRFRALIENSSDMTLVYDRAGLVTYVSPSVERVLARRPADMVGSRVVALTHPEDRAGLRTAVADRLSCSAGGDAYRFRVRHADGSYRVLEAVASNRVGDPAIGGLVVNCRDVTDRELAERALERRLAVEAALVDAATRIVASPGDLDTALADGVGGFAAQVGATAVTVRWLGDDAETVWFEWWPDGSTGRVPPRFDPVWRAWLDQRLATDPVVVATSAGTGPLAGPVSCVIPDVAVVVAARVMRGGVFAGVLSVGFADPDEVSDELPGFVAQLASLVGLAADRSVAWAAVASSERRYRAVISHASELIVVVDDTGVVLDFNDAALAWAGPVRSVFDLVHPDDARLVADHVGALADTGEALFEVRARHVDGSWRALELAVRDLRADPAVGGILVSGRDVTDRRRADAEIRRLNAELAHSRDVLVRGLVAEDRSRSARDADRAARLHDDALQSIAATLMLLRAARDVRFSDGFETTLDRIEANLEEAVAAVGEVFRAMDPAFDRSGALAVAVRGLAVDYLGASVAVTVDVAARLDAAAEASVIVAVAETLSWLTAVAGRDGGELALVAGDDEVVVVAGVVADAPVGELGPVWQRVADTVAGVGGTVEAFTDDDQVKVRLRLPSFPAGT